MLSCSTERKEKNYMALHSQVETYLQRLGNFKMPPICTLAPEQLRQGMRMQLAHRDAQEPIANVVDRKIPSSTGALPIRIYTPEGSGPFPILIFLHGGGFVVGDLDTHDRICRRLANGASCLVVSVAYPLAPEHKFAAAPDASYAVTQWVARLAFDFNGDASRIALGGDSAGGNLTAVVAQMAR